MNIAMMIILILCLIFLMDLHTRVKKIDIKISKNTKKNIKSFLKEYSNKKVVIVLNNEDILNFELFEKGNKTVGVIEQYNDTWFLFKYEYNGEERSQYFRMNNLESIEEV